MSYINEEDFFDDEEQNPDDFCPYCSKEYTDFSDLGCSYCSALARQLEDGPEPPEPDESDLWTEDDESASIEADILDKVCRE